MLNLYQIADNYLHILHGLEYVPDEDLQGKLDELNSHFANFEETAIAMAAYIKNLEAEEDVIRSTIKDYDERADKLERRTLRLRGFLKDMMDKLQIQKIINHPLHKLRVKSNPPAVRIIDMDKVPESEYKVKSMTYLDKMGVREKLLMGETVPGCELIKETRLEIK